MASLFVYVVARDKGIAPNPHGGVCTLAYCKPDLRRVAEKGDYVVGLSPKGDGNRIVYAMRVTGKLGFGDYLRRYRNRERGDEKERGKSDSTLISSSGSFVYWGDKRIAVPDNLLFLLVALERGARKHRRIEATEQVDAFHEWFDALGNKKRLGMPADMPKSAAKGKRAKGKGC